MSPPSEQPLGQSLAHVLDAISDAVLAVDAGWRFTFLNPAAERLVRRPREDLLGRTLWDAFPELRGSAFEGHYRRAAAERVAVTFEGFFPPLDIWVEVRAYPAAGGLLVYALDVTERNRAERLLDGQKHVLEMIATGAPLPRTLDAITELVEQQSAGDLCSVLLVGADGRHLHGAAAKSLPDRYNAAIEGIEIGPLAGSCGTAAYTRERVVVADIAVDPRWAAFKDVALRDGLRACWSQPILSDDGSVLGTVANYRREPGEPNGQHVELLNAAAYLARIALERQRQWDREAEQARVVEAINEVGRTVAAELDLHAIVQTVTDATTRLTGAQFGAFFYNVVNEAGESYALYTLSGVPRAAFDRFPMPRMTEVFGPTFRGEGIVRLADVTRDARYGRNAPYKGMPEGHLPVRSYLAVPVASRSGEVLGGLFFGHSRVGAFSEREETFVVGIAAQAAVAIDNARLYDAARKANATKDRLLASERAARGDAEQANRLKDEFLSVVSHELRTPLNAILGWSQILRSGAADRGDVQQGLEVIERNARAQGQIIEDLLDMSRIIGGKVRLDVQRVDLPAVIAAAVASLQPAADAKGVRLQQVLDPLAGPVSGDPSRLQQVVWNLMSNAVKFTPKGGRVRVTLERVNSHVEVGVSDTGEGISPEFLPCVFERFRQAEGSTTRRHGGLGLGLAIVKQLVELHGGTVHAKSPGLGMGSTFRVALPLMPLHADERDGGPRHPTARPPADPPHPRPPTLAGVRVLAVDDEADARTILRRFMENCGATVVTTASVDEALGAMASGVFDVVVSDIGMPDRDGYDLIGNIRKLPPGKGGGIPAVALTAFARSDDRTRAMIAGFDMHIAKPVEPSELCAVVARLARRASEGRDGTPAG